MIEHTRVHIGQGRIQSAIFDKDNKVVASLSAPWPPKVSSSDNNRGKCMICKTKADTIVNGICASCDSPKSKGKHT